ncbi:RTA1 like protein-domain-containing protein [Triangularia verruculosa]|uniref:RTA1 like protein-domain-containing protein n=1 Tax=Triangularia verruculosa TaxID=2587418 RepID=A0AAN6XB43_9PEZI|nr:RTA1 like protein-domain-containing protein [Triangularia verruculosa]
MTMADSSQAVYLSYRVPPAGNAVMLAAFAALIPLNIFTGIRYKTPLYASLLTAALVVEVVGHVARIFLSTESASPAYFAVYLLGTHWGAAFVGSAIYLILPHITVLYGQEFRLVSSALYINIFFVIMDIFSLVFQSVGIIYAATATSPSQITQAINILLTGLAFQTTTLLSFLLSYRYFRHKINHRRYILDPTFSATYTPRRFSHFTLTFQTATLLLLLRSALRIASFSPGLTSPLAISSISSLLLDDTPILLALLLLTLSPVGRAFGPSWTDTSPLSPPDALSDLPLRRHFHRHPQNQILHKRHLSQPPSDIPSPYTPPYIISGSLPSSVAGHPEQQQPPLTSPRNKPVYHRAPPYEQSPTGTVPYISPEQQSPRMFQDGNSSSSGWKKAKASPREQQLPATTRMVGGDDLWD